MKFSELKDQDVFAENEKIGIVENLYFDVEDWNVTHFEIRFTKEAAHEILGAKMPIRNMMDILAVKEGNACCSLRGLELDLSKSQLHSYLRLPK